MTFRQSLLLLFTAALVAMLAACGSSPIVVAFSSPPASLSAGAQVTLTVTVTHDSKKAGVTFSVSCANTGQCGSFSGTTPTTTTYQAPVAIPSGGVTITATSVTKTSVSAKATINITPATTLSDGKYVFQLFGEDSNGPLNVVGAFTVASGAITGGEEDFVDPIHKDFDQNMTGTITAGAKDSNLQIVLVTGDTNIGVGGNGKETLNLTQTSPSGGILTWFDGFAAGSGRLNTQNAAAAAALPAGGYAFLTNGFDSSGIFIAIGGVLNVDDLNHTVGTISGAGSVFDSNDGGSGTTGQDQTFAASTVLGPTGATGAPDSFGRVTFTLNPTSASFLAFALVGYIVDSTTIELVETADSLKASTGGIAFSQASADVGNFSTTNLSGASYAVGAQGADNFGLLNFVGSLTFNSDLSVSGEADFNDFVNQISKEAIPAGATYKVDPTGRVTVTGLVLTDATTHNTFTFTLQLYLDGNGNALSATMDTSDVTAGPAYQQTSGATTTGSLAVGAFGAAVNAAGHEGAWSAVGPVVVSSSSVTGFTDFNYFTTTSTQTADVAVSGTVSNGSGAITGLDANTPANSDTFDFYTIDSNRVWGIESDNAQLGLIFAQHQN